MECGQMFKCLWKKAASVVFDSNIYGFISLVAPLRQLLVEEPPIGSTVALTRRSELRLAVPACPSVLFSLKASYLGGVELKSTDQRSSTHRPSIESTAMRLAYLGLKVIELISP